MRNENRAVFDRASERYDFAFQLPSSTTEDGNSRPASAAIMPPAKRPRLLRLIDWAANKMQARRNRLAILELSDGQLKDIGVSRCQADGGFARYRSSESHNLERRCL